MFRLWNEEVQKTLTVLWMEAWSGTATCGRKRLGWTYRIMEYLLYDRAIEDTEYGAHTVSWKNKGLAMTRYWEHFYFSATTSLSVWSISRTPRWSSSFPEYSKCEILPYDRKVGPSGTPYHFWKILSMGEFSWWTCELKTRTLSSRHG